MEFNLADLFEAAVDAYPEREYLVADGKRRTYAEMETRANQLAHYLAGRGIGPGDHVGIYAYNCVEWVETAWAVFKLRAVWININYRYVKDELRYLLSNADLRALVYAREFSPLVAALAPELPDLRELVVIEDGSDAAPVPESVSFETALSGQSEARDFGPRSGDDLYILYTGGTTGMPKGVVWRHEDVFYALGGGTDPVTNTRMTDPSALIEKGAGGGMVHLPVAPLMHGATQWSVMGQSFVGSKIVLIAKFDPDAVWRLVGEEGVNSVMITGDAMGKPLVEQLDAPEAVEYDLSSLLAVVSSAALFSAPVKDQFFERLPHLAITDAIGSSEGGNNGMTVVTAGNTAMKSGPTVHLLGQTVVFDEDLQPVAPGSGRDRQDRPFGRHPSRLLQRPEEDGRGVHLGARDPVRDARRLRHRGRGRLDHVARSWVDRHQLGRREDLPRGGGVGRALAPRRHGRDRVRCAGRAMGPDGGGHRAAPSRAYGAVARGAAGALSGFRGGVQGAASSLRRGCSRALAERETRLHLGRRHRDGGTGRHGACLVTPKGCPLHRATHEMACMALPATSTSFRSTLQSR